MVKLIPLLTDRAAHGGRAEDAFDVIVPCLPGYGFSDRPTERGMNPFKVAALWARLMAELGYERFAAQGGDWGSAISTALGLDHAQRIIGIHLNYIAGRFLLGGTLNQTPDGEIAKSYLAELRAWWDFEGGYSHVQSTKPQTLGYALNDSPVGLAAWIVEKFRTWSDCAGELEHIFTRDELLTNVMIYWVTETLSADNKTVLRLWLIPTDGARKIVLHVNRCKYEDQCYLENRSGTFAGSSCSRCRGRHFH